MQIEKFFSELSVTKEETTNSVGQFMAYEQLASQGRNEGADNVRMNPRFVKLDFPCFNGTTDY